jgi:hypothetical protein
MSARDDKQGINTAWQLFKHRYTSNIENPPEHSSEHRLRKARTVVVIGLFLVIGGFLIATVGGQPSGWFVAAAMGGLVLDNIARIRKLGTEHDL